MDPLLFHKTYKGKWETKVKFKLTQDLLKVVYTPGVAKVAQEIAKHPMQINTLTARGNTVAVLSDGSSVLGLGNIGPYAAYPVMEGKAILFKTLADVDAVPLVVGTQDPKEIIKLVRALVPSFAGINLEDIKAPQCFAIEEALQECGIPVFHDDQHGTAIVVTAALLNAAKVVKKPLDSLTVVINGAGAAGSAIAKMLSSLVADVILCDSKGILHKKRKGLISYKRACLAYTNKQDKRGLLCDALLGADVLIGVSVGRCVTKVMIRKMAEDAIVFALANPIPEIMPKDAKAAGACVVATGRSDFPNQINNVLAFPGVFRGALDAGHKRITQQMQLNAAYALARLIKRPTKDKILPFVFDKRVVKTIGQAVRRG